MRRAGAVARRGAWPADRAVDCLTLAAHDRHRRRVRLTCDGGTDLLLDLDRATLLDDGDGLRLDDGGWIAVRAAVEEVLEVTAPSAAALARLAWHIGNRHHPAQLDDGRILVAADPVMASMLRALGADLRPCRALFRPEGGAYDTHHDHPPRMEPQGDEAVSASGRRRGSG